MSTNRHPQDMQCVRNCDSTNAKKRVFFEQPVIQTLQMFIGEMGCWLVVGAAALYDRYKRRRTGYEPIDADGDDVTNARTGVDTMVNGVHDDEDEEDSSSGTASPNPLAKSLTASELEGRRRMSGWKVTLLALPACCDIAGTTLMNVGLLFVAASIYQMTRGALVLFVGLFSVLFLKRRLGGWKWISLIIVVLGVAVVGLAGALAKDEKAVPKSVLGDEDASDDSGDDNLAVRSIVGVLLIALAQIFTASQFVLEESIMEKYSLEPLRAVGWEGIWGFLVTVIGMIVLHLAYGQTPAGRNGYFDAREGLYEILHYRAIAVSSVLIMISIG